MGYYATLKGDVFLREDTPQEFIDEIKSYIKNDFLAVDDFRIYNPDDTEDGYDIELWGDTKFRDDYWYKFFAIIKPYVFKGWIRFTGEDGAQWKYSYCNDSEGNGTWFEESVVDVVWGYGENLSKYIEGALEELDEQTEND